MWFDVNMLPFMQWENALVREPIYLIRLLLIYLFKAHLLSICLADKAV